MLNWKGLCRKRTGIYPAHESFTTIRYAAHRCFGSPNFQTVLQPDWWEKLGIPPELSVQDPFSNRIIRVINILRLMHLTAKTLEASFAKNNEYLMLDLSNALDRQTRYALPQPHFEANPVKNRNGKPAKYARVDQSALIQNDVDAGWVLLKWLWN